MNSHLNWHRISNRIFVFDKPLFIIVMMIMTTGLVTLYSAGLDFPGRFEDQIRNFLISLCVMWVMANIPPQTLMRFAVPLYIAGVSLLIAVAIFGLQKKGAKRWLYIGITTIQPSEMLKIAAPLMLAWYFQQREGMVRARDFLIAVLLLAIPVGLINKQPDLGTATLVLIAGFTVVFLAGLSWKFLVGIIVSAVILIPTVLWPRLHGFQKDRVLTFLDPHRDPLGRGFHILQSQIAIGSGGVSGKGWTKGTQSHLDFIPEHTTDFISAVYSEEFGLIGNIFLICLYFALIVRCLMITSNAPTVFSRLLAGSISVIFFAYSFANMGMVCGILPVVGVPLPFMSYGGTALVTLGMGLGILMSIQRHRKLVQT